MAVLPYFKITQAGLDAINGVPGGPELKIGAFRIGSAHGYEPDVTDTALRGIVLYEGTPVAMNRLPLGMLDIIVQLPAEVGPFNFGEVGLYLTDGTLFALAAYQNLQEKHNQLVNGIGNIWVIHCLLEFTAVPITFSLENKSGLLMMEVEHTGQVTGPILMLNNPNNMIIHEETHNSSMIVVLRDNDYRWFPSGYEIYAEVTISASDPFSVSAAIFTTITSYNPRSFLVQDPYGNLRVIDSISGSTATYTYEGRTLDPGDKILIYSPLSNVNVAPPSASWLHVVNYNGFDGNVTADLITGELNMVLETTVTTGALLKADNGAMVPAVPGVDYMSPVGGIGTVTEVSIKSDNGFAGTVADPNTTPEITLETTVADNSILKASNGALVPAIPGVDYAVTASNVTTFSGDAAWNDYTSSRAIGTDFQNNSDFAIQVTPTIESGTDPISCTFRVGFHNVMTIAGTFPNQTWAPFGTVTVPPYASFSVQDNLNNVDLVTWFEFADPADLTYDSFWHRTPDRFVGVQYTNLMMHPLMVSAVIKADGPNNVTELDVLVDSVSIGSGYSYNADHATHQYLPVLFIVPAGETYEIDNNGSGDFSIVSWSERQLAKTTYTPSLPVDKSATRLLNTTYTNSTGQVQMVYLSVEVAQDNLTGNVPLTFSVDGDDVLSFVAFDDDYAHAAVFNMCVPVPAGSTYEATGTGTTVLRWAEQQLSDLAATTYSDETANRYCNQYYFNNSSHDLYLAISVQDTTGYHLRINNSTTQALEWEYGADTVDYIQPLTAIVPPSATYMLVGPANDPVLGWFELSLEGV